MTTVVHVRILDGFQEGRIGVVVPKEELPEAIREKWEVAVAVEHYAIPGIQVGVYGYNGDELELMRAEQV